MNPHPKKRPPAGEDFPTNAPELREACIREACIVADVPREEFQPMSAAGQFATLMLSQVPCGGHAYCTRDKLGILRANRIIGRTSNNSTRNDLDKHHPSWAARAERKASKLLAVWATDARRAA